MNQNDLNDGRMIYLSALLSGDLAREKRIS